MIKKNNFFIVFPTFLIFKENKLIFQYIYNKYFSLLFLMGIEKFFSTINKNFQIVSTIDLENSESDLVISKYLFFDFN